jgi:hypothetical protein
MSIIGCDLHSRYQQIAMPEMETGEIVTRRVEHENGEAKEFCARLPMASLIGMEAASKHGKVTQDNNTCTRVRILERLMIIDHRDRAYRADLIQTKLTSQGSALEYPVYPRF